MKGPGPFAGAAGPGARSRSRSSTRSRSRSVSPPSRMEASGSEDIDVMDNELQAHKRQRERSTDSVDREERSPASPLLEDRQVIDSGDEGPGKDELSSDEQPENLSSSNLLKGQLQLASSESRERYV